MPVLSSKVSSVKESSTLKITAKAAELAKQGIDVVGFGPGEPDFETPEHIKLAAVEAINAGFTRYTAVTGIVELRDAIAKKLLRDNGLLYQPNQIVVSNGAKHSLSNIFAAILNGGDEVLVPSPYWLSYSEMIKIAGGKAVLIEAEESNNFEITKESLDKNLSSRTKAIIINTPCNPTGMVCSLETLKMIAGFAVEHDLFVISDEIYEMLIYDGLQHVSIASLNDEIYKRTIVVNGFSKAYAMTGWRMGYTASSVELAKIMGNIQSHCTSNTNSITQKAALAALTGDQDCVRVMCAEFEKRRDYIYERISSIPYMKAVKPNGAFYLFINLSELFGKSYQGRRLNNTEDVADILINDFNVAVVPGADFGGDEYMRLSYAIHMEQIKKGMDRIQDFVNSLE